MSPVTLSIILISVVIISTALIIFLNMHYAKQHIGRRDIRLVITQLIVLVIWIATFAQTLKSDDSQSALLNAGIFVLAIIFGTILIRNIIKEIKMRDVSHRLIDRLEDVNDQLHSLDEKKTEFVSLASHQLRSPLTAIKGYISMILEGDYGRIPKKAQEALGRVLQSTNTLTFLLNDFLDIARIEKGEMHYTMQKFNLTDLLEEVANEFDIVIEGAGLEFHKEYFPEHPVHIKGDRNKLKQVISNLLDNAIKYTPEGTVTIGLLASGETVTFQITDSGIGINKETRDFLFDKFSRAENAKRVNIIGTGLGLFLAREIITAHEGAIWVESEGEGKGSSFIIKLPIEHEKKTKRKK